MRRIFIFTGILIMGYLNITLAEQQGGFYPMLGDGDKIRVGKTGIVLPANKVEEVIGYKEFKEGTKLTLNHFDIIYDGYARQVKWNGKKSKVSGYFKTFTQAFRNGKYVIDTQNDEWIQGEVNKAGIPYLNVDSEKVKAYVADEGKWKLIDYKVERRLIGVGDITKLSKEEQRDVLQQISNFFCIIQKLKLG